MYKNLTSGGSQLPKLDFSPQAGVAMGNAKPTLLAITTYLSSVPRDPPIAACLAFKSALDACIDFAREQERPARELFARYEGEVARATGVVERANAGLPLAEPGAPHSSVAVKATTSEAIRVQYAELAIREQVERVEKSARALADRAVAAGREAKRAVLAAVAEGFGPAVLGLGAGMTIDDHASVAALRTELATVPPSKMRAWFDGYVAAGDAIKERNLTIAASPVLREIVRDGTIKLAERLGKPRPSRSSDSALVAEIIAAGNLLEAIKARHDAKVPPSTAVAENAYENLLLVFSIVLGLHASLLSKNESNELRSRLMSGTQDPLAVMPRGGWVTRWIVATGCGA